MGHNVGRWWTCAESQLEKLLVLGEVYWSFNYCVRRLCCHAICPSQFALPFYHNICTGKFAQFNTLQGNRITEMGIWNESYFQDWSLKYSISWQNGGLIFYCGQTCYSEIHPHWHDLVSISSDCVLQRFLKKRMSTKLLNSSKANLIIRQKKTVIGHTPYPTNNLNFSQYTFFWFNMLTVTCTNFAICKVFTKYRFGFSYGSTKVVTQMCVMYVLLQVTTYYWMVIVKVCFC